MPRPSRDVRQRDRRPVANEQQFPHAVQNRIAQRAPATPRRTECAARFGVAAWLVTRATLAVTGARPPPSRNRISPRRSRGSSSRRGCRPTGCQGRCRPRPALGLVVLESALDADEQFECGCLLFARASVIAHFIASISSKSTFSRTAQSGQHQSSGMSLHGVPCREPLSRSAFRLVVDVVAAQPGQRYALMRPPCAGRRPWRAAAVDVDPGDVGHSARAPGDPSARHSGGKYVSAIIDALAARQVRCAPHAAQRLVAPGRVGVVIACRCGWYRNRLVTM